MDTQAEFLEYLKEKGLARKNFLGLLNLLIGRRIEKADGAPVSKGVTWRELAALLKKVRWDTEAVRDLGFDPATLPQRDRERFWYSAIAHAGVDSERATEAGNALAEVLKAVGYSAGPPPRGAMQREKQTGGRRLAAGE